MAGHRASADQDARDTIDYRRLAEFRLALRRFQAFSESAARDVGLTSQQHQALLAIAGFGAAEGLAVGELAERLLLRHNSAAELVNRLEALGFVERLADDSDGRRAIICLTRAGRHKLRSLASAHLSELQEIGPRLRDLIDLVTGA